MMIKLEEIVSMVSRWCPEVMVKEAKDGNITLDLNMRLDDSSQLLIPFDYDDTEEDG